MPPLKREDQERKAELDQSLGELRAVIARLHDTIGLPQRAVAGASGVNVGFLSQLLDPTKGKTASLNTIRKLTLGLASVVDDRRPDLDSVEGLADEVTTAIEQLEARFNFVRPRLSAPGQPIEPGARNYVRRSVDTVADSLIAIPGTYQIDGPPQSGRSTLARRIADLARRRGHQVAEADLSPLRDQRGDTTALVRELVDSIKASERDGTKASERDSNEAGEATSPKDIVHLNGVLSDWLAKSQRRASLLLIDNVSSIGEQGIVWFEQVLRDLDNLRSSNVPDNRPFADLSVWLVSTSHEVVSYATSAWRGPATSLTTAWFTREEVKRLADVHPHAAGAASRRGWLESTVESAYSRFKGQPLLTHWYVYLASAGSIGALPVYESLHVSQIAEFLMLDAKSRESVLASTEEGCVECSTSYLEDLHVVKRKTRDYSCPLYASDLRAVVAAKRGVD